MMRNRLYICVLFSLIMMALCACGAQSHSDEKNTVNFESLSKTGEWNLSYAKRYKVEEYGDYRLVGFDNDLNLLIVPENEEVPSNLPNNTTVVKQPVSNAYVAASSVMDMICEMGSLDKVRLTSTKYEDWHLDSIKDALDDNKIIYAGKYNQPDYEVILSNDCDFVIENTMIWHTPDTKEKLEEINLPVMVELSSYEEHPLGRLEWIKLYGLIFGQEDNANRIFKEQEEGITRYKTNGEKSKIAFFYITANGVVNVKKPSDYVPKMIEMAGGEYVPGNIEESEENALSTSNMQFEEFYASARDADIIIYNSTTVRDVNTISDIVSKNKLLGDFKAVKEGNVYMSGSDFYQKSTGVMDMVGDVYNIISNNGEELHYLKKLN